MVRPGTEGRVRPPVDGERQVQGVDVGALEAERRTLEQRNERLRQQLEEMVNWKEKAQTAISWEKRAIAAEAESQDQAMALLSDIRKHVKEKGDLIDGYERVAKLLGAADNSPAALEDETRRLHRQVAELEGTLLDLRVRADGLAAQVELLEARPAAPAEMADLADLILADDDRSGVIVQSQLVLDDDDPTLAGLELDPEPDPEPEPEPVVLPPPVLEPPPPQGLSEEDRARLLSFISGTRAAIEDVSDYLTATWRVIEEVSQAVRREEGWDLVTFIEELLRKEDPELLASNARTILDGLLERLKATRLEVERL